jgi:UDP-3-O-[3-hydroxymyristoyl] N-acetylglucosamine deacetylase
MSENRTVGNEVVLEGIGVHSGKTARVTLKPSDEGRIVFRRPDLGNAEILLDPVRAIAANNTTLVGERFRIMSVEHLLATLFAFGVGSVVIELDGEEIPIMDGSALPFVRALEKSGTQPVQLSAEILQVVEPCLLVDGDALVEAKPAPPGGGLIIAYSIEFPHPAIQGQSLSIAFGLEAFVRGIAPARTFGFLKDAERLRSQGLALGSSFDNTIVLDDEKVLNGPLRFSDEFVRHKLLDFAGDLALFGRPLGGIFRAHKAGHSLHIRLVRFYQSHPEYWRLDLGGKNV